MFLLYNLRSFSPPKSPWRRCPKSGIIDSARTAIPGRITVWTIRFDRRTWIGPFSSPTSRRTLSIPSLPISDAGMAACWSLCHRCFLTHAWLAWRSASRSATSWWTAFEHCGVLSPATTATWRVCERTPWNICRIISPAVSSRSSSFSSLIPTLRRRSTNGALWALPFWLSTPSSCRLGGACTRSRMCGKYTIGSSTISRRTRCSEGWQSRKWPQIRSPKSSSPAPRKDRKWAAKDDQSSLRCLSVSRTQRRQRAAEDGLDLCFLSWLILMLFLPE